MLDFRLETFLSVCETMNYRKTAELLHITQPAVTQHIQHLEQDYGCKLFQYENRKLKKTEAAAILEQYARPIKVCEGDMIRKMHQHELHHLQIGATKTISECVIGPYAKRFIEDADNTLCLLVDNTERLLALLDTCKLDFALIEGYFDKSKYGSMFFSLEPFVGVCAQDHPFAGRSVSISDILSQTLLCREEGSGTRAILENTLLNYNESTEHFKRRICISSFPIILDFVREGMGISFVYEVLAKHAGLATFTLENCKIEREFNFVYLPNTDAEAKIQKFIQP